MADVVSPASVRARPEYGDACSEVSFVHRAVGVAPISQGLLTLTGEDRVAFVHSISSNDVKSLNPGEGCASLILTPKGKILFPVTVLVGSETLDLLMDEPFQTSLKILLDSSLIMEDVSIQDRSEAYRFFHLAGEKISEVIGALALPMPGNRELSSVDLGEIKIIRCRRSLAVGLDIGVPSGQSEAWFEKLVDTARTFGGGPLGTIAQDILRIEGAIPKFGVDFTTDNLPQEASLENRAVSFTKGCYTGQEVVARVKTYGGVNRRLVGLVMDGPAAGPSDRLFLENEEAGRITSSARSIKFSVAVALAMVSKTAAAPGTVLRVSTPAGPAAKVVDISSPRPPDWGR